MHRREGSNCAENLTNAEFVTNKMNANQDNMEMWRTISNLAAANHQLTTVHSLTIDHLQWLFYEFRKSQRRNHNCEIIEKNRNSKASDLENKGIERHAKNTGKSRIVLSKQCIGITTMNKKLRRLKKLLTSRQNMNVENKNKNVKIQEIAINLKREIEELNILRKESQAKNERLTNYLEDQRLVIEQLTQKYEDSQKEFEVKDKNLEQMSQKLIKSELESAKLLVKLETFRCEKGGNVRITKEEADENLMLRARLAEQDEVNKKQLLTLDEAMEKIRTLELTVQELTAVESLESNQLQNSQPNTTVTVSAANEEFKRELMLKREARQRAIAAISAEMDRLRSELEAEKLAHSETTKQLENFKEALEKSAAESKTDDRNNWKWKTDKNTSDHVEALRLFDLLKVSDEVTSDLWLQLERTDDLRFQLENDPQEHRLRIVSLKRLSEDTRSTLRFRKQQVNLLKDRLAQILVRLGDRCFLAEPDDIKTEAERQIEDIGRSRNLCDERSRILAELKDHCFKEIHELKLKLDNSKKDNQSLEEELHKIEDKMDAQDAEILNLESQLGLAKADCRDLQNQMSVINSLFTQMLLGASSAEMDLDRLTRLLQENHDLICEMAKENGTEAAALPKLLLDIIQQVDGRARVKEDKKQEEDLQHENIAHNLPKVWRVLLELLSCHAVRTPASDSQVNVNTESAPDSCYKSVDTPTGPRLVISVSKTYIRLKELILEKKHLEKEMNRMKQLNTHLESKLSEQEKRLSTVSDELSKTWNIVGRMQAQHQQLHTHEKILRYELQQKRIMLQELKQELEYCREKWESARQKNTNTEIEWRSLRREFAARKALVTHADSFNNSGESGFSDERDEESDEDDETDENIGKRIRPINSRKRPRKDGSRAITPDTESEQPTDTELSEPKTESSSTTGHRTPTPETEAELESSEIIEENYATDNSTSDAPQISESINDDPLDEALTNVIQKLIETDESRYMEGSSTSSSDSENIIFDSTSESAELQIVQTTKNQMNKTVDEIKTRTSNETCKTIIKADSEASPYVASVFTIGPIPNQIVVPTNCQFSNVYLQSPSNVLLQKPLEVMTNELSVSLKTDDKCPSKSIDIISEVDNISIGSSSSIETVRDFSSDRCERDSSASPEVTTLKPQIEINESIDVTVVDDCTSTELLDERSIRLQNLEEQAQWLVRRVNDTNRRSFDLSSRLEVLHETYGLPSEATAVPDILSALQQQNEVAERENSEACVGKNDSDERARND